MTPESYPHRPHRPEPTAPPRDPAPPRADSRAPLAGGERTRYLGHVPELPTYIPTSVTAVSQADGEA